MGVYKYEKFNINDCYKDYDSNSNHFSLSHRQYLLIIKTYLRIYCYELFFLPYPVYFFFGGKLTKNRIPGKVVKSKLKSQNNKLISLNDSVGFSWYDRPFPKFREFTFKKLVKIVRNWRLFQFWIFSNFDIWFWINKICWSRCIICYTLRIKTSILLRDYIDCFLTRKSS